MTDHIAVDVRDGVQTIRFDRPEVSNALTGEMFDMAADAVALAERNTSVRAVVIAGMPGVFTAGQDAQELRKYVDQAKFGEAPIRFMKTFATIDKPVVAAVDGLCVGIGTVLLLHCDYVVASEWSIFSAPCADIGMPPEGGASLLAPLILGYHRAFELLVLGEQFDLHRALQSGPDQSRGAAGGGRTGRVRLRQGAGRQAAGSGADGPPADARRPPRRADPHQPGSGGLRRPPALPGRARRADHVRRPQAGVGLFRQFDRFPLMLVQTPT